MLEGFYNGIPEIGDTIIILANIGFEDDPYIIYVINRTGRIIGKEDIYVDICFDEYIHGHSCMKKCINGYGRSFVINDIRFIIKKINNNDIILF